MNREQVEAYLEDNLPIKELMTNDKAKPYVMCSLDFVVEKVFYLISMQDRGIENLPSDGSKGDL